MSEQEQEEPLGWNEPVSIDLDTETALRALLQTPAPDSGSTDTDLDGTPD